MVVLVNEKRKSHFSGVLIVPQVSLHLARIAVVALPHVVWLITRYRARLSVATLGTRRHFTVPGCSLSTDVYCGRDGEDRADTGDMINNTQVEIFRHGEYGTAHNMTSCAILIRRN